jgi:hypothetical protein
MAGKIPRELPVRKCALCGGEFFRETTLYQMLRPTAMPLGRNPSGQLSEMSLTILVCLCGAPQRWDPGGVRAGRTPNVELCQFIESMEAGSAEVRKRDDPAPVRAAAEEKLVKREDLEAASAILSKHERAAGRLLSGKHPRRKPDNACWRPPTRKPAARRGRDWLALELQKRGFEFRKARAVVNAILDSMAEALRRGEKVFTPLGTLLVQERTPAYERVRPVVRHPLPRQGPVVKKAQTVHKVQKRVVFKLTFRGRG